MVAILEKNIKLHISDGSFDTTPKSEFEAQELLKYSKDYYRQKGEGRPTKKDRREIDGYLESDEKED